MSDPEKFQKLIENLKEYGDREHEIPLKIVEDVFSGDDDAIDEAVDTLIGLGYDVTSDMDEESLGDELVDIEDEELAKEVDEALVEEISEIKLSAFDETNIQTTRTDDLVNVFLREMGEYDLLTAAQEVEFGRLIQDGLAAEEKKKVAEIKGETLSEDEEMELSLKIEDGQEATEIMINSNLRLVVYIARKYTNRGLELMDLILEGTFGLRNAALKFDPYRGNRFSTYATSWIRQAISRAIADKGKLIRTPVHMHENIGKMVKVTRYLNQKLNREPTIEEIAAELNTTVERVQELQMYSMSVVSLDTKISDGDETTLRDTVADSMTVSPSDRMLSDETERVFDELLKTLTPREEQVIRLRNGIGIDRSYTLAEVGDKLGVTRERVRQIQTKAIMRIRKNIKTYGLQDYINIDKFRNKEQFN